MSTSYAEFIARRAAKAQSNGLTVETGDLHYSLKPFQVELIKWAASVGRPAVWADTGLGKTRMQLEWSRVMADTSLIVAPLAVAEQTVAEAASIHIEARYVRSADQVTGPGVYITNYEMVEKFDPAMFGAVALDEASILKQNPGELVFTAFGGVGSELWVAVKHGRRALGIELKASYWKTGCEYLAELEDQIAQPAFDFS